MEPSDLRLEWSTLTPYTKENIEKLKLEGIEGVYRISKKEQDGKFYVILVGSATDLKAELLKLISENSLFKIYFDQGGDFSFRVASLKDEVMRKAVNKQMYKQYAPRFNTNEPDSTLDVKINLN